MANDAARFRAFPDLLSKFTSAAPCSDARLHDRVLAELHSLFNTRPGLDAWLLDDVPHVKTSTLCYGVRDPSGPVGKSSDYAAHLLQAMRTFESRLIASSITVRPMALPADIAARWLFRIEASLRTARPYPLHCFAVFDLMDGSAVILR